MKKTIGIILIAFMLTVGMLPIYSNAATFNVAMNASVSKTKIDKNDKTVEVILSLVSFSGVAENSTLGYQGTLEFDKTVFESATVTGLNGWTVTYDPTKSTTIVGDTAAAKDNTDIAKITLKLNSNLDADSKGNIELKNVVLTDGTNEITYNKTFSITLEKKNSENTENKTNTPTNTTNTNTSTNKSNTQTSNNSATSGNNTNKSNSSLTANTAITKLPAAGLNNVIILAIVIVFIAAIIFKFKSRKIKY